jgi:hypothetical protein
MEGDSCSKHEDRIAVGYYSGSGYGLNGCEECIKNVSSTRVKLYNMETATKIFNEKQEEKAKQKKGLIEDDTKSVSVGNHRGDNWELFGQDKIDFLNNPKMSLGYSSVAFKDSRSNYYDSSD